MSCSPTIVGLVAAALAAATGSAAASTRIRYDNDRIAETFGFAMQRSATFRDLVAAIDASTVVVYIDEGQCGEGTVRACVRLLPVAGERRLQIRIDPRQPILIVVRQLAHELQHAAEIAAAPGVIDDNSLSRLYETIGFRSDGRTRGDVWETRQAQAVEALVLKEASAGSRTVTSAYFGKWRFVAEQSTFERTTPIETGMRWHHDRGYGLISIVVDTIDVDAAHARTAFVYRRDGRDYTIGAGDGPRRTIAETVVDKFTTEFVLKVGGETAAVGRCVLDRGGRTMTIETRGVEGEGAAWRSVERWEKLVE